MRAWIIGVGVCLVALGTASVIQTGALRGEVLAVMEKIMADEQTRVESSWVDANGIQHTVTTFRREGESAADFAARHAAEVDALRAIYP